MTLWASQRPDRELLGGGGKGRSREDAHGPHVGDHTSGELLPPLSIAVDVLVGLFGLHHIGNEVAVRSGHQGSDPAVVRRSLHGDRCTRKRSSVRFCHQAALDAGMGFDRLIAVPGGEVLGAEPDENLAVVAAVPDGGQLGFVEGLPGLVEKCSVVLGDPMPDALIEAPHGHLDAVRVRLQIAKRGPGVRVCFETDLHRRRESRYPFSLGVSEIDLHEPRGDEEVSLGLEETAWKPRTF